MCKVLGVVSGRIIVPVCAHFFPFKWTIKAFLGRRAEQPRLLYGHEVSINSNVFLYGYPFPI